MTRPVRRKKSRRSLLLHIVIFAFVTYAAMLLIEMQITLAERHRQLNALKSRVETQRIANKELERQFAQGVDGEDVERIAREKLGYVAPDEVVYIDISGK